LNICYAKRKIAVKLILKITTLKGKNVQRQSIQFRVKIYIPICHFFLYCKQAYRVNPLAPIPFGMGRQRRGGRTPPEVVLTNKILIVPHFPVAVTYVKIGSLDSFITRIALFYLKHLPLKDN
jgi:hypothetical protein